jgi:D-glycero-beta-D-manno-heptose-7-phosphate kinase
MKDTKNDKESLVEIVKNFRDKRIAVVGDIVLDWYVPSEINRTNPEAVAPLYDAVNFGDYRLGCAGNVAINLSRLGAHVTGYWPLSNVSSDIHSKILRDICGNLRAKRVIQYAGIPHNGPTMVKMRAVSINEGSQRFRLDFGEPKYYENKGVPSKNDEDTILDHFSEKKLDAIVLADYNKQMFKGNLAERIIDYSRDEGIPVFVDPKVENIAKFQGATLVCPNFEEARAMVGLKPQSPEDVIRELKRITNTDYTLITASERGIFMDNGSFHHIPTKVKKVVDVSGAGDTVISAVTLSAISHPLGIENPQSVLDATQIANYAAGIVVEMPGTASVSSRELIERILI